ncbi:hypothetical protein ACQ5SO_16170 [Rhodovulum sp. DZ06]|uniref:hypothetical protein n=1 Tax=Rhodovulum sp. DZ06 TaxID=3425126 RepID=UPI003D328510
MNTRLEIRVHGAFAARWQDGGALSIRSAKQKALLAVLATAANGRHTRAWLQDLLWSRADAEHGRASLRRCLSDLRAVFGPAFDDCFEVTNSDVALRQGRVALVGDRRDGQFLEGLDIREDGFEDWLREKRQGGPLPGAPVLRPAHEGIMPRVAILPFLSPGGVEDAAYFSDLLALEVSRALSRSQFIDVISHLSSRSVAGGPVDLDLVQRALGVDYVLHGSLRGDARRFLVDADLYDARRGRLLSTLRSEDSPAAVLAGESRVAHDLANHIGHRILSASAELARTQPLPNVETHALLMSAIALMHRQTRGAFDTARRQFEELISRAPGRPEGYAWISKWHILAVSQGWSEDAAADTEAASQMVDRALQIDPRNSFALAVDGMVQADLAHDHETSRGRFEAAEALEPSNALAAILRSRLHSFVGESAAAVRYADRALALSPLDPHSYFFDTLAATAYVTDGLYEKALGVIDRSLDANAHHVSALRVRTVALAKMGREAEAAASMRALRALDPTLTVQTYLARHPAAAYPTGRDWAETLSSAGLPRH